MNTAKATMRDRYHELLNISRYRETFLKADEIASKQFNQASIPQIFPYSTSSFHQWLDREYQKGLKDMRKGHWMDTGELNGTSTNSAVKERILQNAPNNYVDGAWLDRVMPCGSATRAEAVLSQIRFEEGGAGDVNQNHPNIYGNLLVSVGLELPPVYSKEFSNFHLFLDSAFEMPVFQLAVGMYPRQFLPELLGMTLWFEWNSTPSSLVMAKCLRQRGIDSTYYKVHQSIDNRDRGHGYLAREAVNIYFEDLQEDDDDIIQSHWQRIWTGYYTWDEMNTAFEADIQQHLLALYCKN
jgi:hypothetical protein